MHEAGFIISDIEPYYVVLGETHAYNFQMITTAIRLIARGARFIATNPDPSGPGEGGIVPACGAMAALVEKATGVAAFFIGKPNPLMMRTALNYLGVHSENTVMIGDRMETDIVAGVESGMETVLVLSGVTRQEDIRRFPYQPTSVVPSVAEIDP
jgi:NagD protein